MVDKARVKLVTVIASYEMQERVEQDLERLGARGYTVTLANGRGEHGVRNRGFFEIGNVRVEALVSPAVADAVLEHFAKEAPLRQWLAFAQDVEAVPMRHFT
jgi:nitrogen regulatory protein P-II 2